MQRHRISMLFIVLCCATASRQIRHRHRDRPSRHAMQALTTTASPCAASQPPQRVSRRARGSCCAQARPSSQAQRQDADTMAASRRGALLSLVSVAGASVLSGAAPQVADLLAGPYCV